MSARSKGMVSRCSPRSRAQAHDQASERRDVREVVRLEIVGRYDRRELLLEECGEKDDPHGIDDPELEQGCVVAQPLVLSPQELAADEGAELLSHRVNRVGVRRLAGNVRDRRRLFRLTTHPVLRGSRTRPRWRACRSYRSRCEATTRTTPRGR